jgi:hypothetical protein
VTHIHHFGKIGREVDLSVVSPPRLQHWQNLVPEILRVEVVHRTQLQPTPVLFDLPIMDSLVLEKTYQVVDEIALALARAGLAHK